MFYKCFVRTYLQFSQSITYTLAISWLTNFCSFSELLLPCTNTSYHYKKYSFQLFMRLEMTRLIMNSRKNEGIKVEPSRTSDVFVEDFVFFS